MSDFLTGAARAEVLTPPGFLRRKNSGCTEHTGTQDRSANRQEVFLEQNPSKQNSFAG